jgi:DNA polymerase I-like protein with 3'-5' exonuclease and polymerase domains
MPKWNIELPNACWLDPDRPAELQAIIQLVEELKTTALVAIDTETTGLNKMQDLPLFWSLAWEDADQRQRRVCMPSNSLRYFVDLFEDPYRQWIFANAKYDCAILANVGMHVKGELLDVIVMHSMLYEDMPHDLKSMAEHVLGYRWNDFKDTFRFNKAGKLTQNSTTEEVAAGGSFRTVQDAILWCHRNDLAKLIEYSTNDAWGTYAIYKNLFKQLCETPTESCMQPTPEWIVKEFETVADLYFRVELPFTRVLFECEREGVMIDQEYLRSLDRPMNDDMDALAREVTHVTDKAGSPIMNINSNKELQHYLFDVMKYPIRKMTNGGKAGLRSPAVDKTVLERLEEEHPEDAVLSLKSQYGKIKKLNGTYVVGMLEQVQPTGRVHTNYNQHVAVCMPAGELVLTNRGYISVETVRTGDMVITHTGSTKPVVETSRRPAEPIYKVTLSNGLTLRTNGEHQYRTVDTWTKATDLQIGQEVTVYSEPEVWSQVPKWSDFEVSSWGRVRNKKTGRSLAQKPKGRWGHLKVCLYRNGSQIRGEDRKDIPVHRLVLETFGRWEPGKETRHLNGIAWDNTLQNLQCGTLAENRQDAMRHGTMSKRRSGESVLREKDVVRIRRLGRPRQPPSCTAKLSYATAQKIRNDFATGVGKTALARQHSVSFQSIDNIIKDRTWATPTGCTPTATELANEYGVSPGIIRDVWAYRRWQDEDHIEGKYASFHSSRVVSVDAELPEETYGMLVADDHSHVTGGIVTHNTGRLSSSEPNMQNLPRPDEDKEADRYNIRRAFIAPPGKSLIVGDFEQLEMRLLAIMAGEQDMLDIFLRGHDIHMGNASLVFDLPYDDIKRAKKMKEEEWAALSKDQADYFRHCLRARQDAKTVGFGLNYGMQKWTLAKRLGCTPDEAQAKIDAYMTRYPAVKHYFNTAIKTAQETGFSFTVLGRRRYLPDIDAVGKEDRARAERQASNLPIQGSAADVVKVAMIRCHDAQLKRRFGCIMMLQVHDELVFECPNETVEKAAEVAKECMEHAFPEDFAIPLSISLGIADNWSSAK